MHRRMCLKDERLKCQHSTASKPLNMPAVPLPLTPSLEVNPMFWQFKNKRRPRPRTPIIYEYVLFHRFRLLSLLRAVSLMQSTNLVSSFSITTNMQLHFYSHLQFDFYAFLAVCNSMLNLSLEKS